MINCSHWAVRDLEFGNCGTGLHITYTEKGHRGLTLERLFVHQCYGIFIRDMGEGPARQLARKDRISIAAGIIITCEPIELEGDEKVLEDVYIADLEGCHNADTLAINPAGPNVRDQVSYSFRNLVLNRLWLHDDDAPNPGGIPDSLRFVRCEHLLLINSRMHRCCGQFTTSGTAMLFLGGIRDQIFVNNTFTETPDSGSVDQCAIDFEATTRNIRIRNTYFGRNAGPGIEFLDIWGETSYSQGHEVSGNAFEDNGHSSRGGQAGAAGIHHHGGNFATGVIRDNLMHEPGRPLLHGEFVKFELTNNLRASQPISSAMNSFNGDGWSLEAAGADGVWRAAGEYDAARERYSAAGLGWLSRSEQAALAEGAISARCWTAPRAGTVEVRSRALRLCGGVDGKVAITLNGKVLAEGAVAAGCWDGTELNLGALTVAAGDQLRFEDRSAFAGEAGAISWAPIVAYTD